MDMRSYYEAELLYCELIHRNPENYLYHKRLEQCLKLETEDDKLAHYRELASEYPRSHVIRRMPLLISSGNWEH